MKSDTGDGVSVHLEDVVVLYLSLDRGPRASQQFIPLHRRLNELVNAPRVPLPRSSNLPVFVRVYECSNAFVGEDLGEKPFIDTAVDDVNARNASPAGNDGVPGLRLLAGSNL